MSKGEAMLKINPAKELRFIKGPFGEQVSAVMKLSNLGDKKVCFKLKTTAPGRYIIEPLAGIVNPKRSARIKVTLEPVGSITEYNNDNVDSHKFQVLTALAPEGDFDIEAVWKNAKLEIHKSKLHSVLVIAETPSEESPLEMTSAAVAEVGSEVCDNDVTLTQKESTQGASNFDPDATDALSSTVYFEPAEASTANPGATEASNSLSGTIVFVDVNPLSLSPVVVQEEVKNVNQREEISQQQRSDSLEVQLDAVRNSFSAIENELLGQKKEIEQQSLDFESQLATKDQIIKELFVKLDIADSRNLQLKKTIKQMEMEAVKKTHQQDQSVASQTISLQNSPGVIQAVDNSFFEYLKLSWGNPVRSNSDRSSTPIVKQQKQRQRVKTEQQDTTITHYDKSFQFMKLDDIRKRLIFQKKFLVGMNERPDRLRIAEYKNFRFRSAARALIFISRTKTILSKWQGLKVKMEGGLPPSAA